MTDRETIQAFCNKWGVFPVFEGECGFGRECVGITDPRNDNYVDYNPTVASSLAHIEQFFSDKNYEIAPPNAYHKHDCMAVLGRGKEAERQLAQWCQAIEQAGGEIVDYNRGTTGIQALMTPPKGKTIKLP